MRAVGLHERLITIDIRTIAREYFGSLIGLFVDRYQLIFVDRYQLTFVKGEFIDHFRL